MLPRNCPLCGKVNCWREIAPYERNVIELFPFRKGRISIARFQCRNQGKTFSLLPCQLAPYHQYTVESILLALLLVGQLHHDENRGFACAARKLPADSNVTPWLLAFWLGVALRSLRRAHPVLAQWYDLSSIRSGERRFAQLHELCDYCKAFNSRAPPDGKRYYALMTRYAEHTQHHLVGTPSHERPHRAA